MVAFEEIVGLLKNLDYHTFSYLMKAVATVGARNAKILVKGEGRMALPEIRRHDGISRAALVQESERDPRIVRCEQLGIHVSCCLLRGI